MSTQCSKSVFSAHPVEIDMLRKNWGWFLAFGVALIGLGCLALSLPGLTALATEILVGWLLLFAGLTQCLYAFRSRGSGTFGTMLLSGALYAGVGLLLLFFPLPGILTLTLLLAALFVIEGLFKIVMSLQARPMAGWVWVFVTGVLAVLIGGLIWSQWPSDARWVIGLLVGLNMIFGGCSMIVLALGARSTPATAE